MMRAEYVAAFIVGFYFAGIVMGLALAGAIDKWRGIIVASRRHVSTSDGNGQERV